jgi:hypothetical protein
MKTIGRKISKGNRIRQINNLTIYHSDFYGFTVWSPKGTCLEDRLSMYQAVKFCNETLDFIVKSKAKEVKL